MKDRENSANTTHTVHTALTEALHALTALMTSTLEGIDSDLLPKLAFKTPETKFWVALEEALEQARFFLKMQTTILRCKSFTGLSSLFSSNAVSNRASADCAAIIAAAEAEGAAAEYLAATESIQEYTRKYGLTKNIFDLALEDTESKDEQASELSSAGESSCVGFQEYTVLSRRARSAIETTQTLI